MKSKKFLDGLEQMMYLAFEIEDIYKCGNHFYYKALNVQSTNEEEFKISIATTTYNFRYMLIRFWAFVDAYFESVSIILPKEKAKKIKYLLRKVDLKKIEQLRNEILAHHYSKKTKGGYESVIESVHKGEYLFGSGSLRDFEHIKDIAHQIIVIAYSEKSLPDQVAK